MSRSLPIAPALLLASVLFAAPATAQGPRVLGVPVPPRAPEPAPVERSYARHLFGISGKLRAMIVQTVDELDFSFLSGSTDGDSSGPRWVPLFASGGARVLGEPTQPIDLPEPDSPGIWRLVADPSYLAASDEDPTALEVIMRVPFSRKKGSYLNGYHIGRYPTEESGRSDRYAPPSGFIEVTRENQDFQISEHFRLRQFLTKDQHNVWPKYLVLDLRLIDKLELVLQELNAMGVRADRMHVMSGFRTPQYNGPGGDGRAALSRHTYGDAADVWVDNDSDGYMDDLNGDGQRDMHDAAVILKAVDRVEARYPELVGGAGLYPDNGAHGPFIHIDARGHHSRW